MSIYSDKLAYIQVIINYQYSVAQMCTHEDTLAHILGTPYIDDVMKHNELTTNVFAKKIQNSTFKYLRQSAGEKVNPKKATVHQGLQQK